MYVYTVRQAKLEYKICVREGNGYLRGMQRGVLVLDFMPILW